MTGEELKRLRIARGFTQRRLGEKLGYTGRSAEVTIQNWENERHPIPITKIRKLAETLEMPIERFVP